MAPEVANGGIYTEQCDVFSLGVCLYGLVHGYRPFGSRSDDVKSLMLEIENLHFSEKVSPLLRDLILAMLEPNPDRRITISEIQRHPWLRSLSLFPQIVIPKPIVFYEIRDFSDVLKFRRGHVSIDPQILAQTCEFLGLDDEESLERELREGRMNERTTIYYLFLRPNYQEPELPKLEQDKPPPRPIGQPRRPFVHLPVCRGKTDLYPRRLPQRKDTEKLLLDRSISEPNFVKEYVRKRRRSWVPEQRGKNMPRLGD
jgi:serine/threonine protein kinase